MICYRKIATFFREHGLISICVFFLLLSGVSECYSAEGGVRPISMGGAFVGLSDDVHAVSWNPAGLGWQQEKELAYSGIMVNRDGYISADFISDDYVAYAQPISSLYEENKDKYGGIGLYFHNSGYQDTNTAVKTSLWHSGIAYGRKFSKNNKMSWGVALNYYYFDTDIPGVSDSDTAISVNLGFLWYVNDVLSFGLLWENLNEPTYTLFGVNSRLIRVMRPGIAYFLSKKSVLTCDIYDLTGNTSDRGADFSQNIRIGFEHYLTKSFSFRLGAHQPNSKVDSSKFYSTGFGWQRSDFLNIYPIQYYIDYAFIYWQDAPAGVEDYLHQLGITLKF